MNLPAFVQAVTDAVRRANTATGANVTVTLRAVDKPVRGEFVQIRWAGHDLTDGSPRWSIRLYWQPARAQHPDEGLPKYVIALTAELRTIPCLIEDDWTRFEESRLSGAETTVAENVTTLGAVS